MSDSTPEAERRRGQRPWLPALVVASAFAVVLVATDLAPSSLASPSLLVFAALLFFAPSLVYPAARGRGASASAAALGGLLVPVAWIAKECVLMSRLYGAGEAAYYALNPIALGLLAAAAAQMAVAEIVLTRRRSGRWRLRSGAVLTLALLLAAFVLVQIATLRSGPTAVFWTYVRGHRLLFGE